MNFLAPIFLWLIPLVSIPLIIYLFNKNKTRRINFSSLMFLKFIEQESIKKLNFLNILLLLIRMIIILLIIMILSRPIYNSSSNWNDNTNDVAVIVIDDSFSMKHELSSQELLTIIKNITKSFDENTQIEVKSLNNDYYFHNSINNKLILKNITPSYVYDSVDFKFIDKTINDSSYENYLNKYLFFITDLQSNKSINNFQGNNNNWNINFINLSLPDFNASILNAKLEDKNIIANQKFEISVDILNQSNNNQKNREISLFIDDVKVANMLIDLNPNEVTQIELITSVPSNKQYKCYLMIDDDTNNDDNIFYFTLNLKNDIEVAILDDSNNNFLLEALNVINYNNNYKIKTFRNLSDFMLSQSKPSTIYIIGYKNLSEQLFQRLGDNTKLVIFPSDSDLNLNKISKFINLETESKRIELDSSNYLNIDQNINSDILKIFTNIYQNINIENYISMTSNHNTIISLSNNDFLLNYYKYNNNNIFLFSIDLALSSSDLPIKGSFIPMISYFMGSNDVLDFVRIGSSSNYKFLLSNMKISTPAKKEYNYSKSKLEKSFKFEELGYYKFIDDNNKYIASNINFDEFSNDKINTSLLNQEISIVNNYSDLNEIINSQKNSFELWRYLLFMVIFLFLIEFYLSNFYIKNE